MRHSNPATGLWIAFTTSNASASIWEKRGWGLKMVLKATKYCESVKLKINCKDFNFH